MFFLFFKHHINSQNLQNASLNMKPSDPPMLAAAAGGILVFDTIQVYNLNVKVSFVIS